MNVCLTEIIIKKLLDLFGFLHGSCWLLAELHLCIFQKEIRLFCCRVVVRHRSVVLPIVEIAYQTKVAKATACMQNQCSEQGVKKCRLSKEHQ